MSEFVVLWETSGSFAEFLTSTGLTREEAVDAAASLLAAGVCLKPFGDLNV